VLIRVYTDVMCVACSDQMLCVYQEYFKLCAAVLYIYMLLPTACDAPFKDTSVPDSLSYGTLSTLNDLHVACLFNILMHYAV
jgi:hypothetical protein